MNWKLGAQILKYLFSLVYCASFKELLNLLNSHHSDPWIWGGPLVEERMSQCLRDEPVYDPPI